jgi:hypothetical protein
MDLAGGMAGSMFRKLEGWVRTKREEQNQPSWAEWFEWLAAMSNNHKDEHATSRTDAANWRP